MSRNITPVRLLAFGAYSQQWLQITRRDRGFCSRGVLLPKEGAAEIWQDSDSGKSGAVEPSGTERGEWEFWLKQVDEAGPDKQGPAL
jgi:hypothetical protein